MKHINKYIDERLILEMTQINNKDNSSSDLNPGKYQVLVKSNEGAHRVPHFHILHKSDNWEIKLYISNGELYQVERYGKRRQNDKFIDVVKLAKAWLKQLSTVFGMENKRNYEVALIQWRLLNPDNEENCVISSELKK